MILALDQTKPTQRWGAWEGELRGRGIGYWVGDVRRERGAADAVLSLNPPPEGWTGAPWVWVQHGADPWYDPTGPVAMPRVAFAAAFTRWWADRFPGGAPVINTGMPRLERVGETATDSARALGVTSAWLRGKVLTYLPFPLGTWPRNPWFRLYRRGWVGERYVDFLRALRDYCRRHEVMLIVKVRAKDRPTWAVRRIADVVLADDGPLGDALAVSSCLVHHMSTAALHAAAAEVPSLCLIPPVAGLRGLHPGWEQLRPIWSWDGVAEHDDLAGASHWLRAPSMTWPLVPPGTPAAFAAYRESYVGPDGVPGILDAVVARLRVAA